MRMKHRMRANSRKTKFTVLGPNLLLYNLNFHAIAQQSEAFLLMPCHGNEIYQSWGNLNLSYGQREA